jgi:predicted lipid carrier protein YhbT
LKSSRRSQTGEGRLKAFVYLAILISGIFAAVKLVPAYVANYQLKDKMSEQARFAIVNRYTEEQIKDNIFRTIQDLDIPATRDDVKVANTNQGIAITVNYTVPVDLVVYKTDLNFATSTEGRDYMK